jgi:thymidylate synthase
MNNTDQEYFRLLRLILDNGRTKVNRTGVDTIGVFGAQARFNLAEGFPLLTTKKVFLKAIIHELLWFIKGDTNIKYLVDNDVHIWDEWAYKRFCDAQKGTDGVITKALIDQKQFIQNIKEFPEFAARWGDLGEGTYGGMWRAFPYYREYDDGEDGSDCATIQRAHETIDQLKKVVDKLKTNPDDRRMIVSAWHPYWVDHCALPPCHCLFHFNTEELTVSERLDVYHKGGYNLLPKYLGADDATAHKNLDDIGVPKRRLNCLLYQRSCDTFLGVPFNIASYALLTSMIAKVVNMVPGEFVHTYGDLHIYKNHLEQVKEQLSRKPFDKLPTLKLNPAVTDLFQYKYEDISVMGYECHPAIKAPIAV